MRYTFLSRDSGSNVMLISCRTLSGVDLRPLDFWHCGFESRRGHGCLSLVNVVCCQVRVSATGQSLFQRSPTKCSVSQCDLETSTMRPWPTRGLPNHKNLLFYTECPRRNVPDFGRMFLMLKYTDITQNTYVQSWTVTEIMAREVWNFDSCYTLIDYQIHIETGRNMWFL